MLHHRTLAVKIPAMKYVKLGSLGLCLALCIPACRTQPQNVRSKTPAAGLLPYPLNPTLPLDPSCHCASPSQICDAAKQCVERCDGEGHCARWLANGQITDLFVEGNTVYYTSLGKLGSPGGSGSGSERELYRVEFPNGTPSRVAQNLGNALTILGRYQGATYLQGQSPLPTSPTSVSTTVWRITDAGVATHLANAGFFVGLSDKWLVYSSIDNSNLMRLALDGTTPPQTIASPTNPRWLIPDSTYRGGARLLDDYLWYPDNVSLAKYTRDPELSCTVDIKREPLSVPSCLPFRNLFSDAGLALATVGNRMIGARSGAGIVAMDVDGRNAITLWTKDDTAGLPFFEGVTKAFQGWLYVPELPLAQGSQAALSRFSVTLKREPQQVLPKTLFPFGGREGKESGVVLKHLTVSSAGVFWTLRRNVDGAPQLNIGEPEYIFRAPLPPEP